MAAPRFSEVPETPRPVTRSQTTFNLSYVLPYKSRDKADLGELTAYLRWMGQRAEVIIVDGSLAASWKEHHRRWQSPLLHIEPRADLRYLNGKVNGVITGVERATYDKVIVADDDVRYDDDSLLQMESSLEEADVVRPQNYFIGNPWHALWDSGRTLLNRSLGSDYPGTLGLRRSTFLAAGCYDGDVLFENLELIRTMEAAGGVSSSRLDLYVGRRPPDAGHFWQQRTRQAYDEFAQPLRLVLFLSLAPTGLLAVLMRRKRVLAFGIAGTILLAERGRRRADGAGRWPVAAALLSPLWVAERAICSWIAVGHRILGGGIRYGDARLKVAANSRCRIRSRLERSRP